MQKLSASQRAARVPINFSICHEKVDALRAAIAKEIDEAAREARATSTPLIVGPAAWLDATLGKPRDGVEGLQDDLLRGETLAGELRQFLWDARKRFMKHTGAAEASTASTTERAPSEVAGAAPVPSKMAVRMHVEVDDGVHWISDFLTAACALRKAIDPLCATAAPGANAYPELARFDAVLEQLESRIDPKTFRARFESRGERVMLDAKRLIVDYALGVVSEGTIVHDPDAHQTAAMERALAVQGVGAATTERLIRRIARTARALAGKLGKDEHTSEQLELLRALDAYDDDVKRRQRNAVNGDERERADASVATRLRHDEAGFQPQPSDPEATTTSVVGAQEKVSGTRDADASASPEPMPSWLANLTANDMSDALVKGGSDKLRCGTDVSPLKRLISAAYARRSASTPEETDNAIRCIELALSTADRTNIANTTRHHWPKIKAALEGPRSAPCVEERPSAGVVEALREARELVGRIQDGPIGHFAFSTGRTSQHSDAELKALADKLDAALALPREKEETTAKDEVPTHETALDPDVLASCDGDERLAKFKTELSEIADENAMSFQVYASIDAAASKYLRSLKPSASTRSEALEEAARVCDEQTERIEKYCIGQDAKSRARASRRCAEEIRALKAQPATLTSSKTGAEGGDFGGLTLTMFLGRAPDEWREVESILCARYPDGDVDLPTKLRRVISVADLRRADAKHEREMEEMLVERDSLEARLNAFVEAVGGSDACGEHSNANDPWQEALDLVKDKFAASPPQPIELGTYNPEHQCSHGVSIAVWCAKCQAIGAQPASVPPSSSAPLEASEAVCRRCGHYAAAHTECCQFAYCECVLTRSEAASPGARKDADELERAGSDALRDFTSGKPSPIAEVPAFNDDSRSPDEAGTGLVCTCGESEPCTEHPKPSPSAQGDVPSESYYFNTHSDGQQFVVRRPGGYYLAPVRSQSIAERIVAELNRLSTRHPAERDAEVVRLDVESVARIVFEEVYQRGGPAWDWYSDDSVYRKRPRAAAARIVERLSRTATAKDGGA